MNTYAGPAEIERDIRQTRARMDSTIDALKTKLSPGEFLDHALGYLKEGGAEVGQNFARRVRDNPVPLTLAAASIVWLIASERRRGMEPARRGRRSEWEGREDWARDQDRGSDLFEAGRPSDFQRGYARGFAEPPYRRSRDDAWAEDNEAIERYDEAHRMLEDVKRGAEETLEAFNDRLSDLKARALNLRRGASEEGKAFSGRVDKAFHELAERATRARRKVKSRAAGLAQRAGHVAKDATGAARHGADRAGRYYEDNPLVAGALGIAAGALLGSLLATTRAEERKLGAAGEALRRRSADAAGDIAGRMRDKAGEAAQREGLTSASAEAAARDVAERARRVGEEAIEAGREEAGRTLGRDEPR